MSGIVRDGAAPNIIGERPADYAGDVSVEETWRVLRDEQGAALVDVRTQAEWAYVGVPDLSSLEKKPLLIEWQVFPSLQVNAGFAPGLADALEKRAIAKDAPVFFLCRSGQRSKAAAIAMTEMGYTACHNVAGGFEGDLDETRHRGRTNGWKAAGLPWIQS